jgi:hypothetical protein
MSCALIDRVSGEDERQAKEPAGLSRTNWPPSEVASLHRLKSNYANRAFPNLYRTALGEQLSRLLCLIIIRTRQDVAIENVPFRREDKHLVLFRGYMITSAAKQPTKP